MGIVSPPMRALVFIALAGCGSGPIVTQCFPSGIARVESEREVRCSTVELNTQRALAALRACPGLTADSISGLGVVDVLLVDQNSVDLGVTSGHSFGKSAVTTWGMGALAHELAHIAEESMGVPHLASMVHWRWAERGLDAADQRYLAYNPTLDPPSNPSAP